MLKFYFIFHVKWIVSGLCGVNGPYVLRLVEQEYKKERGVKTKRPNFVENLVLDMTRKKDHATTKNVQVCHGF